MQKQLLDFIITFPNTTKHLDVQSPHYKRRSLCVIETFPYLPLGQHLCKRRKKGGGANGSIYGNEIHIDAGILRLLIKCALRAPTTAFMQRVTEYVENIPLYGKSFTFSVNAHL